MIAYSLKNNIPGEKILKDISNMVQKFRNESPESLILYIDVKKISYDDNSLIPKLEYKEADLS